MTDEELIDALRRMSPRLDMLDCENVLTAADRIEELQSQLSWVIQERDDTFARMLQRAEDAEAKLAKAMESLGRSKYWTATMSQAAIKAINESMLEKRRADDAEAKLAKVVGVRDEALNQLDSARHSVDVLEKRFAKLMGANT